MFSFHMGTALSTYLALQSPHQSDVTLVVVGAAGAGKSTIIRKGLKSYGLSEASSSISPPGAEGERFRCELHVLQYIWRVVY